MEFSPSNHIVKYCLQGMAMADNGNPEEAIGLFLQGWNEATRDFEKYLSAYFLGRHQPDPADQLKWLYTSVEFAHKVNDPAVRSAFPSIYLAISRCYEALNEPVKAREYSDLSQSSDYLMIDKGPFYHGTKAGLQVGDMLNPGNNSNYQADLTMNHIYFTALINGAGLAAELARGDQSPRVYIVEPSGSFENDPNVTDKKFPGNPTRSYRSKDPLLVVGEITDWARLSPQELQHWQERLAKNTGKIIN